MGDKKPPILFGKPYIFYGRYFGGGHSPEQFAKMVLVKLIDCSADAPEAVKMQFNVFAAKIEEEILIPMFEDAMRSERQRIGKIIDENWPPLASEIKNKCWNIVMDETDIIAENITIKDKLKRKSKITA